jgi:hypothetical protein
LQTAFYILLIGFLCSTLVFIIQHTVQVRWSEFGHSLHNISPFFLSLQLPATCFGRYIWTYSGSAYQEAWTEFTHIQIHVRRITKNDITEFSSRILHHTCVWYTCSSGQ